MKFRLTSQFVAVLVVALIFLSATLQPTALAAPALQADDSMQEGQAYTIQAGDSLYKISSEYLGSGALWPQIQEATNAMAAEDDSFTVIDQPSLIRVGQKIWIPIAADGEMMDHASTDQMDADIAADHAGSDETPQALMDAVAQLGIAMSHAGLLGDSLAADDLAMAQAHAEHVINILDGEDGRYFGDINRDGKTQNPGDGVGVRGYLEQAETAGVSNEDTLKLTTEAIETALQILAVDTADEATAIADELTALLDQLNTAIVDEQAMDAKMVDGDMNADTDGSAMLFDEADGLFAMAAAQVDLALGHSGFLADELASDSLDAAKNHAEHVINILDGEDGLFYGDNNRDGQAQNPGDGVGVRGYLEQALAIVGASEMETGEELAAALEQGLALVGTASADALAIFAIDTSDDAAPNAQALAESLAELKVLTASIQEMAPPADGDAAAMDQGGSGDAIQDMGMTEEAGLAVQSLVSDEAGEGLLLTAQAQAEMAVNHFIYLQDSLAGDDLVMALTHAEHVINILEGEDGLLFGDNNRDGKTQNPGDGIGVRVYLSRAGEQVMSALDGADAGDLQGLIDAIDQGGQASDASAAGAVRLFAAGSVADAQPVADELEILLSDLQASIAAAVSAATNAQTAN